MPGACKPGERHSWSVTSSRKTADGKTVKEWICWKCQQTKTTVS